MAHTDVIGQKNLDSVSIYQIAILLCLILYLLYIILKFVISSNLKNGLPLRIGKRAGLPLAFRCIKGTGGPVPSTLVGVIRIYPVLYRERYNGNISYSSEILA